MILSVKSPFFLKSFALTCICFWGAFFSSCATNVPIRNVHTDPPKSSSPTTGTTSSVPTAPTPVTIPAPKHESQISGTKPKLSDAARAKKEAAYEFGALSDKELEKYAYELGFDPKKGLTRTQKIQIDQRKKVRVLERGLDSQKERLQYSKVLPWLESDEEKIDFLSIPSIEGRQAWINKNRIWSRAKNLKDFTDVMEAQDIAMGMPSDYVKKSWGEPDGVEVSGNPIYKNERWKYIKQISTPQGYRQEKRLVYFEGGRVVGWETE